MRKLFAAFIIILIPCLAAYSFVPTDTKTAVDKHYYAPAGFTYTGTLENGLPEGYGKLEFKNGSYYEGYFKSGRFDGEGIFILSDGTKLEGLFRQGTYRK